MDEFDHDLELDWQEEPDFASARYDEALAEMERNGGVDAAFDSIVEELDDDD